MIKVAVLTSYSELGASSRLRFYQFLPLLRSRGIEPTVFPLLPDAYLQNRYASKRGSLLYAILGILGRFRVAFSLRKFDLVLVEKELVTWLPFWTERLLLAGCKSVLLDYDDAVFHRYDQHANGLVRRIYGKKIDKLMESADGVSAGNQYIAERAQKAGARRIELLPTVIDTLRYAPANKTNRNDAIVIGWVGTPFTVKYLDIIAEAVRALGRQWQIVLRVVGADAPEIDGVISESLAWSEDREVQLIQGMDIGVMPLVDTPWERGKCGYKLLQYMGCGIPVVASPVGVNTSLVRDGANGYLAGSVDEWFASLESLCADPGLRAKLGIAGRALVEQSYSVQVVGPKLASLITETVAQHPSADR